MLINHSNANRSGIPENCQLGVALCKKRQGNRSQYWTRIPARGRGDTIGLDGFKTGKNCRSSGNHRPYPIDGCDQEPLIGGFASNDGRILSTLSNHLKW